MNEIVRGHKGKLSDLGCSSTLSAAITMDAPGSVIDVSCFGVDANGRLTDDRYMVFFNQTASPSNEVTLASSGSTSTFAMRLDDLPATIDRLVFAASIDGAGTMKGLSASSMSLGSSVFRFSGTDFDTEKAVIIGEIYRRDGSWRFGAVGQGFAGGLSALLAHFGGAEAAPVVEVAAPKISLSKVTLTKSDEKHKVSLIKGASAPKKLIVKATWQDNGDGNDGNDDLDLRVGILLADGSMKLIAAPKQSGSFDSHPYVKHLGDVQVASAKEPATETVEVNPGIADFFGGKVALVFSVYSAVSNGAVSVASLKPVMRIEYGDQVVECAFDFTKSKAANSTSIYTFVIGTAIIDGASIELSPSGLTSKPGSENTPWLKWKGNSVDVSMDGPAVFKGQNSNGMNAGNQNKYS